MPILEPKISQKTLGLIVTRNTRNVLVPFVLCRKSSTHRYSQNILCELWEGLKRQPTLSILTLQLMKLKLSLLKNEHITYFSLHFNNTVLYEKKLKTTFINMKKYQSLTSFIHKHNKYSHQNLRFLVLHVEDNDMWKEWLLGCDGPDMMLTTCTRIIDFRHKIVGNYPVITL